MVESKIFLLSALGFMLSYSQKVTDNFFRDR